MRYLAENTEGNLAYDIAHTVNMTPRALKQCSGWASAIASLVYCIIMGKNIPAS